MATPPQKQPIVTIDPGDVQVSIAGPVPLPTGASTEVTTVEVRDATLDVRDAVDALAEVTVAVRDRLPVTGDALLVEVTNPTGVVAVESLPLPPDAATDSTLATRASEATLATRASEATVAAVEAAVVTVREAIEALPAPPAVPDGLATETTLADLSAKIPAKHADGGLLVHITNASSSGEVADAVEVVNFPATQTVAGTVAVSNFPVQVVGLTDAELRAAPLGVTGTVAVSNLPEPETGLATEATLAGVDASIGAVEAAVLDVVAAVEALPAPPTTVAVSNFPAAALPPGAATEATLDRVADAVEALAAAPAPSSDALTDAQLRAAPVPVAVAGVATDATLVTVREAIEAIPAAPSTVEVSNFPATQNVAVQGTVPMSAAALPLPTGAASETTLDRVADAVEGILAKPDPTSDGLTNAELRAAPVPVSGTVTANVSFPATQPVSGTVAVSNFPAAPAVQVVAGRALDGATAIVPTVHAVDATHNAMTVMVHDASGAALTYRKENENWTAADTGVLMFGRDTTVSPNKYRALALDDEGHLGVHLRRMSDNVEIGTAAAPIRVDPTGTTTQPISAAALPLPAGASTSALQTSGAAKTQITDSSGNAAEVRTSDPIAGSRGVVTRNIPYGTQTVQGTVAVGNTVIVQQSTTFGVSSTQLPAALSAGTSSLKVALAEATASVTTDGTATLRTGAKGTSGAAFPTAKSVDVNTTALDVAISGTPSVSISGTPTITVGNASIAVTGPLTDAQLRATAVPVSLASVPTHAVTQSGAWAVGLNAGSNTIGKVDVNGTVPVSGTFWQATQPISAAALPLPSGASTEATLSTLSGKFTTATAAPVGTESAVLVRNIPSGTQPVSGTVTVGNASLAVTGTFWQATQPVSAASLPLPTGAATETTLAAVNTKLGGTIAVSGPLTDAQLRATAVPVSGTFWQATQPVSLASVPTHAVTQSGAWSVTATARGGAKGTTTAADVTSTNVDANTQALDVAVKGAVAVTGTFYQATQPVSLASVPTHAVTQSGAWNVGISGTPTVTANLGTVAGLALDATLTGGSAKTQIVSGANTLALDASGRPTVNVNGTVPVSGTVAVTGTFWQATQPISAAALPLPTGASTEATLATRLADATFTGRVPTGLTVKAASTAPVAADQALVVAISPNSPSHPVSISGTPTVTVGNASLAVTGTFWQATQPVSGTVAISNPGLTDAQLRASAVPISGTVTANAAGDHIVVGKAASGAAVSGNPVLIGGSDGTNARSISVDASGRQNVNVNGTVPVSGTFWQATQPVSASSLPLPTGAATEATLSAMSAKLPASLGAKTAAASLSVTPASDATFNVNTHAVTQSGTWNVGITGTPSVSVSNFPATQTVAGTVTVGNASLAVTAAALPLPTGAATEASLATVATETTATNAKLPSGLATKTGAVDGTESGLLVRPVFSDALTTGTVNALNGAVTLALGPNHLGGSVQFVNASFHGTLTPEASIDGGTTWMGIYAPVFAGTTANTTWAYTSASTATVVQDLILPNGATHVRIRASAYTSGSTAVTLRAGQASASMRAAIVAMPTVAVTQSGTWTLGDAAASAVTFDGSGDVVSVAVGGRSAGTFTAAAGTFVGTITPEYTLDGSNWIATQFYDPTNDTYASTLVLTNPSPVVQRVIVFPAGAITIRARVSAYTSGTLPAIVRTTYTPNYRTEPNGTLIASEPPCSTTVAAVASSVAAVTVLAANTSRRGASVYNDSTAILYLKMGAAAASNSFSVKVQPDGYFEIPERYTGIVTGAWASANGNAHVTEYV